MIIFEEVDFGYLRNQNVLAGVSLQLTPGLNLVLGPNGCGKSTLLKIAAGIEIPSAGTVTVAGHDMWTQEVAARRQLAYLPEHPDLSPYATVREVLMMVAGLRGEPVDSAENALDWVGLTGLGGRTVRELSKGQRRRAVLAAARIGSPGYLILDEPLEGMDRSFRIELTDWIGQRRADGATIVVVSHCIEAFAPIADRAIALQDGRFCTTDDLPEDAPSRLSVLEGLAGGIRRADDARP